MDDKLLTTEEVAEILRYENKKSAERLIRREHLGFKVGKRWLVPEQKLREWLDKKRG